MAQPGKWVVFWGRFLVLLGLTAGAANVFGLRVVQGIHDPLVRERHAVSALSRHAAWVEETGTEDAALALQRYFQRGVVNAALFLLGGIGLLNLKEWGRKLCLGALFLLVAMIVSQMLHLVLRGALGPGRMTIDLAKLAGAGWMGWWLTKPGVKVYFQDKKAVG